MCLMRLQTMPWLADVVSEISLFCSRRIAAWLPHCCQRVQQRTLLITFSRTEITQAEIYRHLTGIINFRFVWKPETRCRSAVKCICGLMALRGFPIVALPNGFINGSRQLAEAELKIVNFVFNTCAHLQMCGIKINISVSCTYGVRMWLSDGHRMGQDWISSISRILPLLLSIRKAERSAKRRKKIKNIAICNAKEEKSHLNQFVDVERKSFSVKMKINRFGTRWLFLVHIIFHKLAHINKLQFSMPWRMMLLWIFR